MRKVLKFALYGTTSVVVLMMAMSALHGDLSEFDVASVLGLLSDLRKTGELSFTGDRGTALVGFDRGSIVWSECSAAPHSTAPADVVFELLRFREASFEFEALDKPARNRDREEVAPVLASATDQIGEWREVEKVVSSGDVVVTLARKLPADEVVIRRSGWDLIHAIGAGQTVTSIGASMQLNELRATRLVKELAEDGLIELNGRNLTDPDSVETKPETASTETTSTEATSTEAKAEAGDGAGAKTDSAKGSNDNSKAAAKSADDKAAKSKTVAEADAAKPKAEEPKSTKAESGKASAGKAAAAAATGVAAASTDKAAADADLVAETPELAEIVLEDDLGAPVEIDAIPVVGTKPDQEMPGIDLVADETQSFGDFPPPPAVDRSQAPDLASDDLPPPPPAIDVPPEVTVGAASDQPDLEGNSARSRLDKMASELGLDIDEDTKDPVDLDADLRPSSSSDSSLVESEQADKGRWRPFRSRS